MTGETTLIADALIAVTGHGHVTVADISDVWGVSPGTVHRHIAGECSTTFERIRTLFRRALTPDGQAVILDLFTAGTGWLTEHVDQDLDLNGDGAVDTDDVIDAAIATIDQASQSLKTLRAATEDGAITAGEHDENQAVIAELLKAALIARQVEAYIYEHQAPRRKARPLQLARAARRV